MKHNEVLGLMRNKNIEALDKIPVKELTLYMSRTIKECFETVHTQEIEKLKNKISILEKKTLRFVYVQAIQGTKERIPTMSGIRQYISKTMKN